MRILLPALIVAAGILLMAGKIHADSEPGAIPLLLTVVGSAWLLIGRAIRQRRDRRSS
jgi:hypothetical protein